MSRFTGRGILVVIAVDVIACGARSTLDATGALDGAADAAIETSIDTSDAADEPLHIVPPKGSVLDAFPDVPVPLGCPQGPPPKIELITQDDSLYTFDPPALAFTKVGVVACPTTTEVPFSMAVSRSGVAWSLFSDGGLFRVDTGDASCTSTTFTGAYPFQTFGMGYAGGSPDGESLYISSASLFQSSLGTLDTSTMTVSTIGAITPSTPRCELTGTADGRLFAFAPATGSGSHIYELNPKTAEIIGSIPLSVASSGVSAFAFAFWGGEFWMFTSDDLTTTTVTRYTFQPFPHEATMTTFAGVVVGAGVSTCAPE